MRTAYASNGYNKPLDENNSVIIFNNMIHTPSAMEMELYAKRLWDIDRTVDTNVKAQKTPILITCDETQRLTMKNLYMQYDGNMPVIYADKNISPNSIKVLQTGAPYLADRLASLKTQIWNEALTYLGISNVNIVKKERILCDQIPLKESLKFSNIFVPPTNTSYYLLFLFLRLLLQSFHMGMQCSHPW